MLVKSIILSMDRSYRELSKTPIGFLFKTVTSRESDVGGVVSGTGTGRFSSDEFHSKCDSCCSCGGTVLKKVMAFTKKDLLT